MGCSRCRSVVRAAAILVVAGCLFSGSAAALASVPKPNRAIGEGSGGRVIVKYRPGTSMAIARADAAAAGSRVVDRIRTFGLRSTGRYIVVSSTTLSTNQLMKALADDPAVESVEPDAVLRADTVIPNDAYFDSLWGMTAISAPTAWDTSTGQPGVVVASIDTGVDYTHPDLAANMWHNPGEIPGNSIDDDGNGYVDDVYGIDTAYDTTDPWDPNGHGTHTSGTMAGVGNNGAGVAGVCWSAQIMALEYLDKDGSGWTSDAIECINYMTSEKIYHGVNVVAANCSWGGGGYNQSLYDAIAAAGDAGIVVVCSAGNGGSDGVGDDNDYSPSYPASYDCSNIISVAATDSGDYLASFSNYGAASVDLAAPGVGILSTMPSEGYEWMDGTSMAAPHVTGAVALLAAAYPAESMATRIGAILSSVDPVAGLAGAVGTGGRLDVAKAIYRAPVAPADTTGPACAARNARVRRGRTVRLYFRVYDSASMQVTTRLAIVARSGRVVKRWSWDYDKNYEGWWWVKYRCSLKRGTYRILVTGTDLAGNPESQVGRAKLVVR
jgi:subtilisin family serine protease